MWFRYLTASAACAALVGLVAAGFVRTHLFEVMWALAPNPSEESPVNEPIQADGGSPSLVDLLPAAKRHPAATARPASFHHPERDTFAQELERGIRKLAEHRYEIRRSTLELALGNLGLLARSVRVMPDARDGRAFGFRLFALMADGPVAKLGLRNDDVLVAINGIDIATAEQVLDAYGKLKTAPHFVLRLLRERHEVNLDYTIR